jgi:hypothetical protein
MSNDRIDWNNLPQLLRKTRTGATREDLAARKLSMTKASHKGRCHLSNQKRRQMKREKLQKAMQNQNKTVNGFREFKARVRSYWLGQTEEHP